ncbi:TrkH family potassium uptake protein [Halolamina salifodinae]|uniref:Trk system potassium uptake protein TrkH n=1 Tax=Halolamina salifodinae TaxID=1202767 RepID=A0A8T4H2N1_9EURY|nr:TrkH family potassium uptake protein [Halolamina salifodinae]MBP1988084.1 trk system potassium uptake protein TrkH [Halolamina salifodinae]
MLVSLLYQEWFSALSFLIAGGITVLAGGVSYKLNENAPEPQRHHAMIVAALGWAATAFFGAIPFVLAAYITPEAVLESFVPAGATYQPSLLYFRDPLHAVFESMSGYTTTGLTMSVREPSVGHGFLWYRSQMQWIGGAGMIVLSLAILRQPHGTSGLSLYESEGRSEKLRPSIVGTARAIWKIYVGVTAAVAVYLAVATFLVQPGYGVENTIFDAINHAMTGQSTGGFSTLDDSIAGYDSYVMELVHIPAMITGAISIPVYWGVLSKRDLKEFTRDPQVRMLFGFFAVGALVLTAFLARWVGVPYNGDPTGYLGRVATSQAFRDGLFQYISAQTTTGWQTSAIGDWNDGAVVFIVLGAMLLGGSAGATVGGIKILRGYIIGRGIIWEVSRVFLPKHAIEDLRIGQRTFKSDEANDEIRAAATFGFLYLLLLGVSLFVLLAVLPSEFTLADAIFEVATAQGTVGLSAGITGPGMPVIAEVLFIFQMWMGRLEIIPILVLVNSFLRR